jgi:hypothetical protein
MKFETPNHKHNRPQIYFETLGGAIDAAIGGAQQDGAEFDLKELSAFMDQWIGGVSYGQTVRHSLPVFKLKGKLQYVRALTVVLYRMDSGRYELVSYIN